MPWPEPAAALPAGLLAPLADIVATRLGLDFHGDRLGLLARGIAAAAAESGCADVTAFAARLLEPAAPPDRLAALAGHLTIGETYFFREPGTLDLLRQELLPELLAQRGGRDGEERRLRLWSAGCATGEEAYSLAMILDRLIGDRGSWDVDLLATDINPQFLAQARRGIYRDWSFREMPEEAKRCFFRPAASGGLEIAARLRRRVRFQPLNLAEQTFPSMENGTAGVDVILCRNVLIYFDPMQARQAAARLAESLLPGGRLLIGAAEAGLACFTENGALEPLLPTVYRRRTSSTVPARHRVSPPRKQVSARAAPQPAPTAPSLREPHLLSRQAKEALRAGRHEEALWLARRWREMSPLDLAPTVLLARIEADRGALVAALEWAERALMHAGTAPEIQYLRGSILVEMGRKAEAARCFNRAVYLAPDFVLAHYGLGLLAVGSGKSARARRHFDNALEILAGCPPEQEIAGLENMLVRDLAGMIRAVREASLAEALS